MTNFLVGIVVGLSAAAIVVIVWAPWRKVREEPPLDETVESRILLGEDPDEIAREIDAQKRPTEHDEWNTAEMDALRSLDDPGASGSSPGSI
ncbi:MAG: hypothetical protein R3A49_02145 [Acidimicrobiia bacterium]